MFSVPTALVSKSSNGMRAARSWEGWAAAWTIARRRIAATASCTAWRSRMSMAWLSKLRSVALSRRVFHVVSPCGPKKVARPLLSIPCTSQPR